MILFNAPERDIVSIHSALSVGLTNGTINPIIREEMPLADAPRAHDLVINAPDDAVGKIVLIP